MRRQLLPIECIALILEELRGDCGTLLDCALTHSTWYPHAKRVLYKTIHIGTSKAYSTFLHMISDVHLRDLLGRMEELRFSGFANDPAADKFRTLSRVLVALADLPLPRLRHLAFRSATPPSTIPIHVFPDSFFKTFSSVRCLVLEAPNLRFVGLHRLRHLVSALPQLEDFRILAVRLLILNPVNPVPSIATAHPQPRLQQLHLDFYRGWASRNRPDPETTLLYWLALTPTVQERALRVLRLGTVTSLLNEPEIYYDALAHILECLGPSLTDLQVSIDPKGASPSLVAHRDAHAFSLQGPACCRTTPTLSRSP
ncbi:uncharacterized protein B0H18DRAFT_546706 [Fomitopsis serialis]|uniref:uncharacterized protein n=1 Tax=Fomitopsis serialis TaxID=139415 RepID=UPI002008128A|nr:uncharacterized protein B0H18DRAFT_546706 [Neoantrodia serialis]KAH9934188.1 hypothetical protein B0H18DRAFT_546706 [Neoantrodia serialis]